MTLSASACAVASRLNRAYRSAFQDLKNDLKNFGWLRALGWFCGTCWFCVPAAILCYLYTAHLSLDSLRACLPDGSFRVTDDTYSFWSMSNFFQITVGAGKLSFAQAKAIDIIWDIGFGRGGQFLLAFFSWCVFARYATVCMEVRPISYQLYRTIFLDDTASVTSSYRTIKSFFKQRRLRSIWAMVFVAFTMIFIVAFPTLASAMSGYDSNISSFILDVNDNLIPFNKVMLAYYVVHDAGRIAGLSNEYVVGRLPPDSRDPIFPFYTDERRCPGNTCKAFDTVSQYVQKYGLGGNTNGSTDFYAFWTGNNITLGPPGLNISRYTKPTRSRQEFNSFGMLPVTWLWENQTFSQHKVENEGQCLTTGTYKWGFSFLQLTACAVLLFFWNLGLYIMWLRAHFTMKLRDRHVDHISGIHRGVIELSSAMQYELEMHHTDVFSLTEKELKGKIYKQLEGGGISYAYSAKHPRMFSIRRGLKEWFKSEPRLISIFAVLTILNATVWMLSSLAAIFWCIAAWVGAFVAFCIGTTPGSRMLFFLIWGGLCSSIPIALHI